MLEIVIHKCINLSRDDRFIPTALLRNSYLFYEESRNPIAKPYIAVQDMELGIVSSQVPEISRAVSSILSNSLEDGKNSKGGHLPSQVVERVQREIISPYGVAHIWGTTGHRFVLSRQIDERYSEILASILVGRSKDTIFFFTGRYNNLKHSSIIQDVDLEQPAYDNPDQRWFDQFAFPDLERFKPQKYHQIANFVVTKEHRGQGLASVFLDNIIKHYSREYIDTHGGVVDHSQYLLCGKGFWQIGDPPWLPKMQRLGFYLRGGAESFFIEQDWAPLPAIYKEGKRVSNEEYNASFLSGVYEDFDTTTSPLHLAERIPEVMRLARDPRAKLQYFQLVRDFL